MRKLLAIIACLLAFPGAAYAQKSKATIASEITIDWPDNVTGQITPALLRSVVTDILNSYMDFNGNVSFACAANTWLSSATTTSQTCTASSMMSGGTNVLTGLTLNSINPPLVNGYPAGQDTVVETDATNTPSGGTVGSILAYLSVDHGDNNINATNLKNPFVVGQLTGNFNGAGEKFSLGLVNNSYGMGDSFLWSMYLTYANGPNATGDEGIGFTPASFVQGQQQLTLTTVTAVGAASTVSATVTTGFQGANTQTVQTLSISGTNAAQGDWIVVGQNVPVFNPNEEAVKVVSVGSGTITAIFRLNHFSGEVIKPATVLTVSDVTGFGDDRVLVDLSHASYSTGTVSGTSGSTMSGSGTTWSATMVSGNSLNIGAIVLSSDNVSVAPFNGTGANGTLKSYYEIASVASGTALNVYSASILGAKNYVGAGSGSYAIYPKARVLWIDPGNIGPSARANGLTGPGQVILEYSTSTWSPGDNVELAICPYPDVSGLSLFNADYMPGGVYRATLDISNSGVQPKQWGLLVDGRQNYPYYFVPGFRAFGSGITVLAADQPLVLNNNTAIASPPFSNPSQIFSNSTMIQAVGEDGSINGALQADSFGNSFGNFIIALSGEGTLASPTATIASDQLLGIATGGWTDASASDRAFCCEINFIADGNWSAGVAPGRIDFRTRASTATTDKVTFSLPSRGGLKLVPVGFASAPTGANVSEGTIMSFNDANQIAWGATITAGSATGHVLGYYDGTNWTVMGK